MSHAHFHFAVLFGSIRGPIPALTTLRFSVEPGMLENRSMLRFVSLVPLYAALAAAQTPGFATLVQDVQAHQKATERIREDYTFHQITRTDELDSNGKVKGSHSVEREVFFVKGRRVGRLVKKDGVALSGKQEEDERKRVTKRVEELLKMPPLKQRQGVLSSLLDVMQVSSPKPASWNGRNALVFEFQGNPKAKAKGLNESAAKKMSGTIWIDDKDRQVAHIKIRFDDNFRIGGGLLASVSKGTEFEIDQAPLGEGLWMEKVSDQHLALRVVTKGIRQNVHTESFDFKKFQVGATEQIGQPPKPGAPGK